jgi:acyl-CoA synthetase (AMP-forming)/AMP-acid ligase II
MMGYWNEPEKTAECLGPNGWLLTGDVVHYDEDGFLYVTDHSHIESTEKRNSRAYGNLLGYYLVASILNYLQIQNSIFLKKYLTIDRIDHGQYIA